jgi:acetyl esterase/lipase
MKRIQHKTRIAMMRRKSELFSKVFVGMALFIMGAFSASALVIDGFEPDAQVVYKTVGTKELKLHVFNPENHSPSDQRPAIVFFFGGGWAGGSPTHFHPQCEYLASRGIVAMSAEYRVKSRDGTTPRECVQDGKSAVRWIRQHANELGIDPDQIIAGGGSAGGHIAAATGTTVWFEEEGEDRSVSSCPDALVLFNPVIDNGPTGWRYDTVKDYWEQISPMHNISEKTPPTVIFLGTKDGLIPVATAQEYKRRMEQKGRRCDLHLYEGQTHGFFNYGQECYAKTVAEMDRFLVSLGYLKEGGILPIAPSVAKVTAFAESLPATKPELFVDADESNTVAVGAEETPFSTINPKSGNLWRKRVEFGFECNGTDGVFECPNQKAPMLKTTASGLEAGKSYGVYACFLSNPAHSWRVRAGLQPDAIETYTATTPVGRVLDFGIAAGAKQNQLLGFLGNATASSDGTLAVYIDKTQGGGSSERTWYEGIALGAPRE